MARKWAPTSGVDEMAILVVNTKHNRFGQIGRLTAHDWKEYGILFVGFPEGTEQFPDGLCRGDPPSPVKMFSRLHNEKGERFDEEGLGPRGLEREYIRLGIGDERQFRGVYLAIFGESFY